MPSGASWCLQPGCQTKWPGAVLVDEYPRLGTCLSSGPVLWSRGHSPTASGWGLLGVFSLSEAALEVTAEWPEPTGQQKDKRPAAVADPFLLCHQARGREARAKLFGRKSRDQFPTGSFDT